LQHVINNNKEFGFISQKEIETSSMIIIDDVFYSQSKLQINLNTNNTY
jgi:hypothetical protein